MSQQWSATIVDTRTFGQQIQRLLDDLNRPDLTNVATMYLQDAMRFYQRRPFFYSDTDNTTPLAWTPSQIVTVGTTIQFTTGGVTYNFVAGNAGTTGGLSPNFASVVGTTFAVPATSGNPPPLPPPASGTPGTIDDNGVIWLNNGPIIGGFAANSQLTTLYNVNQYQMPIDLVALTRVEITWAGNVRWGMEALSYRELRNLDVIRPTPPTTYPTYYAWYQQKLYVWPYPVALYPITISYRGMPSVITNANQYNIWTTQGEAMIRHYAEGRIYEAVIGDPQMAQQCYDLSQQEFYMLQQQNSQQNAAAPIPPSEW